MDADSEQYELPVRQLPLKVLNKLSFLLNPDFPGRDWKAFAGELDFTLEEVRSLERALDPTLDLIKRYDSINVGNPLKLSTLLTCLNTINRKDAVQDITEENYLLCKNKKITTLINNNEDYKSTDFTFSENYDVFISYAMEDVEFAKRIVYELEKKPYYMRVCIDFRDFLPGFDSIEQVVDVIESRCKKVIVILSNNFNVSENCDHQAKVALSLSPGARRHKVIPVLYEACTLPSILRTLTYLNYTDPDHREYFWDRLTKAITIR